MAIFSIVIIYLVGIIFCWFIKNFDYQDKIEEYEERMHQK